MTVPGTSEPAKASTDRGYFFACGLFSFWLLAVLTGFVFGGAIHLLLAAGLAVLIRSLRAR